MLGGWTRLAQHRALSRRRELSPSLYQPPRARQQATRPASYSLQLLAQSRSLLQSDALLLRETLLIIIIAAVG